MTAPARPLVIGAGWSGLACAVRLARSGLQPLLLDAAPHAGGRARTLEHDLGGRRLALDNGQHLLVGAYRETLAAMRTVGVDPARALARAPFSVAYPDGWHLAAKRAPAPWHLLLGLLDARGPTLAERWSLAVWSAAQRRRRWRVEPDAPATELFAGQPAALVRRLWRPLCLAALNVELEDASAAVYLNVLRDSLGAGASASDLLLPRAGLSTLFPDAALSWLRAHGAEVRLRAPVRALRPADDPGRYEAVLADGRVVASSVVLAVGPERAAALLQGAHPALEVTATRLRALRQAPICTVYLKLAAGTRLARAHYALRDEPARGRFGQWVFDRGALDPALDGVLSVVISGAGPHLELTREALARAVAAQVAEDLGLPMPSDHVAIVEKRATIVPAPGLARPPAALPAPGLFLAADAADSPYPSTIEGSVRSGLAAAEALLQA